MTGSELQVAGCARERDDVADVGYACQQHEQPLEAQPEPGVRGASELPRLQVPPVVGALKSEFVDAPGKMIVAFLALAAADDLADGRDQHIHSGHRPAVVVL